MSEFICRPGYCVKCCSEKGMAIPVTIGDLYRGWFYRQKTGERTSFYNVFEELSDDWVLVPSPRGELNAMPVSKIPCRNLDPEEKKCSVHGVARYCGCALFPEDMLLPAPPGYKDGPETMEFINSLECFKEITLTEERKREIMKLRGLVDKEIELTVRILDHRIFPPSAVRGKPSKRVQRELNWKMRYISDHRENMRKLRENLVRNNILQDYETLVMTEDPGFSFCEEI